MSHQYSLWDRFYQRINMIFNGVVASSMIPFAFIFLQNQKQTQAPLIEEPWFETVKISLIVISLLPLIVANRLSPGLIRPAQKKESIKEKLAVYQIQKLKQFAIVEVAALVALIGLFLLKAQIFSFIYVGVLFIFAIYRPTFSRVCKEINESERNVIEWSQSEMNG